MQSWTDEQRARATKLYSAGWTLAYWCGDAHGRPANGGSGVTASVGAVHVGTPGAAICEPGCLHATYEPHRWRGARVWVVALEAPVIRSDAKIGTNGRREIIAEVLPENAISQSVGARLGRKDLSGANLIRAGLIRANLSGADLRDANLEDANLTRADLRDADLRDANLIRADLRSADLSGADLSGADLRDANLEDANLIRADLRSANLRGANLIRAVLRDANLRGADLIRANLRSANLRGADLRDADLRDANLIRADLRGAKGTIKCGES